MTVTATEAPTPISVPTTAPRPSATVRAAVIGLGRAGISHAAVLSTIPNCELVGLSDPRSAARRNARGLGLAAASFASVEKLLEQTSPTAVFVSPIEQDRAEIVRRALRAGAAVQVDRPFAPNAREAEALVSLAAEKNLPLACGHSLAYHPVFTYVRAILQSGALGATRHVRSSMYLSRVFSTAQQRGAAPAGAAGGVVMQASSDLLFLLHWYLGVPLAVRAQWNRIYGEFEDELHGMLIMEGGREAGFDSSWSVPGYPHPATVIELEGENGKMLASDDALELDLIAPRSGLKAGPSRLGHDALPRPARFDLDGEDLYLQDATFLAWATGGPAPPNHGAAALDVARVTDALYTSAREGGKVIEVAR